MNQFGVDLKDLNFKDKDGNIIDKDINEYMNKIQKDISFPTKLQVGDIVKLKGVNYSVMVKYLNYEIKNIGIVDYAGIKLNDSDSERLVLFNQKDIETILTKEKSK